jgi:hypothetical protein
VVRMKTSSPMTQPLTEYRLIDRLGAINPIFGTAVAVCDR